MTELARKDGPELQVSAEAAAVIAGYEARITLYKEQIGTGYIGIGKTLAEAKESGMIPHGQWEAWVEQTTGLNIRQAQRCMQAAAEIKDGSALARLEMSKALMLLSSGLEEAQREEIAEKAAEEGASVRKLQEEIKQMKVRLVHEAGAAAEIREALKKTEAERNQIKAQMQAAYRAFEEERDRISKTAYEQGKDDGANEGNRAKAAMEAELREAKNAATIQIDMAKKAQALAEKDTGKWIQEARNAREIAEKEAREAIRKEYENKLQFNHTKLEELRERLKDAEEDLKRSETERGKAWDAGFASGQKELEQLRAELDKQMRGNVDLGEMLKAREIEYQERLKEMDEAARIQTQALKDELDAAEAREAKRAEQLEQLKKERQDRAMANARGVNAETMGALDLTAAVREFIGKVGVLPQMGAQLAEMGQAEREAILTQVLTVQRWTEGAREALNAVTGHGSVM